MLPFLYQVCLNCSFAYFEFTQLKTQQNIPVIPVSCILTKFKACKTCKAQNEESKLYKCNVVEFNTVRIKKYN